MGTILQFKFAVSGHKAPKPPEVQIYVDANQDGDMEQSEQVRPLLRRGNAFSGEFEIPRDTPESTGFLVRFRTTAGARWRLSVVSDQPKRHLVYEESDRSVEGFGRIIGWCRQ